MTNLTVELAECDTMNSVVHWVRWKEENEQKEAQNPRNTLCGQQ